MAHLESAGLVERRPMTDDRRAHLVDLTPDGVASAHDLITQRVAFFESVLATWSDEDMQTFATLLARHEGGAAQRDRPSFAALLSAT